MFAWLIKKWATKRQIKEVEDFLSRLKSMNSDEIGFPLAVVLETAEQAKEERGIDVYDPYVAMDRDPAAALYFSKLASTLQGMGRQALAPGPMVWTHTLRATVNHHLRDSVREMWIELSRGAPYAEAARNDLMSAFGIWPNLDRLGDCPKGMEPQK